MEKEKITEFTRRIGQCNRSGLTLITYEICFVHCADAKRHMHRKSMRFSKRGTESLRVCKPVDGNFEF